MNTEPTTQNPFAEFAQNKGDYYADVFLRIQKSKLGFAHINVAALIGSFVWAALRANWTLFIFGFVIDLIAAVNASLYFKYGQAAIANAEKDFLVARYEGWAQNHLIAAIVVLVMGRILFAWAADRLYVAQYNRWRVNHDVSSGFSLSRLTMVVLVSALIVPLMIYRSSQFAPDERSCIRQDRAMSAGETAPFKSRFDCFMIGEFPTFIWIDRPDKVTYPRDENGNRTVLHTPASDSAPPVTLNTYVADAIDNGIGYLTVFYGYFFDGITLLLRTMLNAISAVFVGTPWMIAMGVLTLGAYKAAGPRIATFVGASLGYLAIFGFWQAAMDTLSLVTAASIICVVAGLPLGIWVGKSRRGRSIMTPVLDVMQTIPSFVYLLPAIAFFSIGKPPGILATVIFAMPPMVRLTALGLQQVPESTKEAALAFGANPRQLLTKVELPLALPSIMAGVNQVVMMSLSMVVIAALIGAGGMGFIVAEALENTETGSGILAGAGIALLAMMIDKVVQRSSKPGNS
jgi:glycine betaine/proline transport system permease protein